MCEGQQDFVVLAQLPQTLIGIALSAGVSRFGISFVWKYGKINALTAASPEIWEGWVQRAGPGWPVLITGRWRAAQVTRKTGFALLAREE